jgi:DMSO/TMAO reductase YedYZ molybdopterin-dependent catalytic subunit
MVGGPGLDARLFTDLSQLEPGRLVTPIDSVYVRTAAPPGLRHDAAGWTITVRPSGAERGVPLSAADLAAAARPMGPHVMECAGNGNPRNFGLMSAVEWDGVPLERLLDRVPRPPGATAVLVSGVDHGTQGSRQSLPGASWVFPLDVLGSSGPFLAVRMNGQALTPDHGAPVRLAVPGWYGCAWLKWVDEIRWVARDEPATSQMREFAGRTHQNGVPALARDYDAPAIDTAAMPIRVEQRRIDGRLEYRVVGIVWGGTAAVDRLMIRFATRDSVMPVRVCPPPATHHTWALWTHRWRPAEPGYYDITLKVADPAVRTRRLDLSFYIRRVRIDEI